uniref:Regulator of microtubule dynamics protein 1 n=1 Tax=Eiseniibacteriota bacterium TaxID=2212470 RepID=A0A832MJ60_UNCEI
MSARGGLTRWSLRLALAAACATAPAAPAAADDLSRGDAALAAGRWAEALAAYETAYRAQPTRFDVLWRMARAESELGEDAKGEEQRRLVSSAVEHARAAVRVAPDSALGHVWLAVALGRQALKEGPRTRLALAREIKSEADRAIELDARLARAFHVRGAWHRKIAGLSAIERMAAHAVLGGVPKGASMEHAVEDFRRAVALEPDYVNHRLELGRTYLEMKRYDEARAELERAIALPPTSHPRDPQRQEEARRLLARVRKG